MSTISNLTHGFSALNCLVLDANISAAQNTRVMLSNLGIGEVEIVRDHEEAFTALVARKFDLAIIEWDIKPVSGIEFVKQLRFANELANPTQPILMLTARSTPQDEQEALGAGVNEVAVRPLSPQGLAARIHAIVTRPQSFILSPNYRGPDRRIAPLSNELEEQRIQLVPTVASRAEAALYMPDAGTKVILPDFSLRMKVNLAAVSAGLMSHEAVEKEFINEGLEDVDRINYLFGKIEPAIGSRAPMERMCTSSHIVQARAEAYEYQLCAKIAGFLTDFCKHYFNVHNPTHRVVLEKHIQALQVVLKTNMRGDGGKKGAELAQELSKLVFKFV